MAQATIAAIPSTRSLSPEPNPSVFRVALIQYIDGMSNKKKSHKKKFIANCLRVSNASDLTAEEVNKHIQEIEEKGIQRRNPIAKIFRPIVGALKDFDKTLNGLASADPMPSAIIWAALSLVVQGANRYIELFETIRKELKSLKIEIECMSEYEELYGDSEKMRDILCDSYICILRFWSAVEKQCEESSTKSFLKQTFSVNADKLNKIIEEMKRNSEDLAALSRIVEDRLAKGAREDAQAEWEMAKLERVESRKERKAASEFREQQRREQQDDHYRKFCAWLCSQEANGFNTNRHNANVNKRAKNTCQWLLADSDYVAWKEAHSTASNPMPASILWVHGPPGSGKTFLCSYAIQDVQDTYPDAVVIYHFLQFDTHNKDIEILKILADRLFQIYWDRRQQVSEELYSKTQSNPFTPGNIQQVIEILVKDLAISKIFFFIDGLDEELDYDTTYLDPNATDSSSRWKKISSVLQFIISLVEAFPRTTCLWCSSQNRPQIHGAFSKHAASVLDVKEKARGDVTFYLLEQLADLEEMEVSEGQKEEVVSELTQRAQEEGNFLWARLMVSDLQAVADNWAKVKDFIAKSHPSSIDEYYQRIFSRIDPRHRELASEVFALIAFARRPLLVKEIQEAVGILRSREQPRDSMPFISKLKHVFAPLIEVRGSAKSFEDHTCHLFHSTLQTYLRKHPEIFKGAAQISTCRITPNAIANACLHYLSQSCYAKLLQKSVDGGWVVQSDDGGEAVEKRRFLIYSAKYWDKHLDDLSALESPDLVKDRVRAFMMSPNFQTCIQVQSLWVSSQFGTFSTPEAFNKTFFRRVLPGWFIESEDRSFRLLLQNYRLFLREWRTFLRCTNCHDPECSMIRYAGHVDRCWWAALGPMNFLSKLQGRYTSFVFKANDDETVDCEKDNLCESVCTSGNKLTILRLQSHDRISKSLTFLCEHWTLNNDSTPVLNKQQTIQTDETLTNWPAYVQDESSNIRIGRASPAAFNSDCSSLRVGTQVFVLNRDGFYMPAVGVGKVVASLKPSYFEEWGIRGDYVVLAARRRITRADNGTASKESLKAENSSRALDRERTSADEQEGEDKTEDGDDSDDSDDEESQVSGYSSGDEDDSSRDGDDESDEPYESWSECSTEYSDDVFEDDIITPWAGPESEGDSDPDFSERMSETESDETDEGSEDEDSEDGASEDEDDKVLLDFKIDGGHLRTGEKQDSKVSFRVKVLKAEGGTADGKDLENKDQFKVEGENGKINEGGSSSTDEEVSLEVEVEVEQETDSESDDDVPLSAIFGYGRIRDDDDDCHWDTDDHDDTDNDFSWQRQHAFHLDRNNRNHPRQPKKSLRDETHTSITIFDTRPHCAAPKVFHFSQQVQYTLFDSPPVIHPTSSLMVWPLGCGTVLFADFLGNTYFCRRLRPSTVHTRQIFMKCRFSLCGQYLHVACLEAQRRPRHKEDRSSARLALMVSTYRLCLKKTCRSPPTLIHRAKVVLGSTDFISVSNLPYTLTWTRTELYFTCSDVQLKVYRVSLFNPNQGISGDSVPSVLVPEEALFLPETAENRKVYFFPSDNDHSPSRVIIGSDVRPAKERAEDEERDIEIYYGHRFGVKGSALSPPIGCYLQKADLGDWVESKDRSKLPEDQGIGRFDRLLEKFNPEDDCDRSYML
ncbi:hypothetical protein EDD18DRAFT_1404613 [Armillaria luteobubalina]|uniref:NACHT domain-containing protein n=1 Tax=Armillaria luteobubalina TaxID=153913 RepID=A0AA39NWG6_9AGAR|nr:hypothetical protein EDD18DRAFT_1404613 [Armillaria luteobubalina]